MAPSAATSKSLFSAHLTGRLPIRNIDHEALLALARSLVRFALDGDDDAGIGLGRNLEGIGCLAVQRPQQHASIRRDAHTAGGADFFDLRLAVRRTLGSLSQRGRERADGEEPERFHEYLLLW